MINRREAKKQTILVRFCDEKDPEVDEKTNEQHDFDLTSGSELEKSDYLHCKAVSS